MDAYKVWDKKKNSMENSSRKTKIGEFEAQKRLRNLQEENGRFGLLRNWLFQDGPYKFRGITRIDCEAEDATQSHVFELKAVGKYKEEIQKFLNL